MSMLEHIEASVLKQPRQLWPAQRRAQLETLTRINIDDMLSGVGLGDLQYGRVVVNWLLRPRAEHFARKIIEYDNLVGTSGLAAGGAWAVQHFVERFEIAGQAVVPPTGSLLVVANHPGLCDTMALFAAINRPDLLVVAARRPFLTELPHTASRLLFVEGSQGSRIAAVRAATRHLRDGGAVLTFPSGQIEPDPAVLPGAVEALASWSRSISVFARLAQDTTIVPAIVSGVISPEAINHPLVQLRRDPADRQWLAGLLQIQLRALQQVTVRVAFGAPIHATHTTLHTTILDEARRLIANVSAVGTEEDPR